MIDLDNQRFLKVSYKLYLKITRKTSRFGKSKVDYIDCPDSVRYQAYSSHSKKITQNEVLQPSETKIFQIKNANSFALNNANNVIGVHTKDSDLPKSIDLTVSMRIPRYFDFRVSVFCQLWFELETSYNCNIIPDLKLMDDNKDSGLGGFQIKSIEFIAHSKSISKVEGKTYEDEQNITVLKLTDLDLNFSINDFKYYPKRQKYALSMGSKPLIDKTSSKSMMEYMGSQTFMPTCKLYNWFENVCHLNIILTIGDNSNCNQEFEYFTSVSPDYLNSGVLQFTNMDLESLFNEEQAESLECGILPSYSELPVENTTGRQLPAFRDEKIPDDRSLHYPMHVPLKIPKTNSKFFLFVLMYTFVGFYSNAESACL